MRFPDSITIVLSLAVSSKCNQLFIVVVLAVIALLYDGDKDADEKRIHSLMHSFLDILYSPVRQTMIGLYATYQLLNIIR